MRLFTDLEPTLELIASSKQVERKTLRPTIVDLKERLVDKDIFSYSSVGLCGKKFLKSYDIASH